MDSREPERCAACGAVLHSDEHPEGSVTTVRESDKEITLVHCPKCATLLVHVDTVPLHAR